eukprot:5481950-Pyramimonas_sp.AAC.1
MPRWQLEGAGGVRHRNNSCSEDMGRGIERHEERCHTHDENEQYIDMCELLHPRSEQLTRSCPCAAQ